jgi:hypothetical protein
VLASCGHHRAILRAAGSGGHTPGWRGFARILHSSYVNRASCSECRACRAGPEGRNSRCRDSLGSLPPSPDFQFRPGVSVVSRPQGSLGHPRIVIVIIEPTVRRQLGSYARIFDSINTRSGRCAHRATQMSECATAMSQCQTRKPCPKPRSSNLGACVRMRPLPLMTSTP